MQKAAFTEWRAIRSLAVSFLAIADLMASLDT
jgi:hypothetical protein